MMQKWPPALKSSPTLHCRCGEMHYASGITVASSAMISAKPWFSAEQFQHELRLSILRQDKAIFTTYTVRSQTHTLIDYLYLFDVRHTLFLYSG